MNLEPINYPVVKINAPELANNAEFVAWLNQRTCATWHKGGGITEFSDIFTWIEKGEGSDSDMPEPVWDEIIKLLGEDFFGVVWITFLN